jgi:hypothetical protein
MADRSVSGVGHPRAGSAPGRVAQRILGPAFPRVQRDWWALNALRKRAQARVGDALPHLKYALHARRVHRRWAADTSAAEATETLVARHGLAVSGGPFKGLRYVSKAVVRVDFAPKLLGAYEAQLHPWIERLVAAQPRTVINIGAAEGYYAIGMARRLPNARVVAFELDPWQRRRCRALALANDAEARVAIQGRCTVKALAPHVGPGAAVLCDCEGAELELLDLRAIPALHEAALLVELHDIYGQPVSSILPERFAATHDIELVRSDGSRDPTDHPALRVLDPRERVAILNEYRPVEMAWALMLPRRSGVRSRLVGAGSRGGA